jgi:putative PIN family toxin of toxin-antitoxin system
VLSKPYLAGRIVEADVDILIAAVSRLGQVLPTIAGEIPHVARDRKDDYLLAQAERANADVILTGDDDLLSLRYHKSIWILSPAEFVADLVSRS